MTLRFWNAPARCLGLADRDFVRPGPPRCEIIEHGIVPVRAPGDTPARHLGGVYKPGGEVAPLSLQRRQYGPKIQPFAPEVIQALRPKRVAGQAMFGGILVSHYGHFTLESTARLWWLVESGYAGPVVFQALHPGIAATSYIDSFFELLGLRDRLILADQPLQFDAVIVPEPALELRGFAYANAQAAFRDIGRRVEAGLGRDRPRKLYISRTRLDRGLGIGEAAIEAALVRDGFTVLHPETRPLAEQIALICGAERVVGMLGSGMHNLIYSSPKQVIYICRVQQLDATYPMIDRLVGHDAHYAFGGRRELPTNNVLADPYLLDAGNLLEMLAQTGWIERASIGGPVDGAALQRAYLAEWQLQSVVNVNWPALASGPARFEALMLAAALRPGDARTLQLLVPALLEAGRVDSAFQFAHELLRLDHGRVDQVAELAACFSAAGYAQKALSLLQGYAHSADPNGDVRAA